MDLDQQSLRLDPSSRKKNLEDLIERQYKEASSGPPEDRRPYAIAATENSRMLNYLTDGLSPSEQREAELEHKRYRRPG